MDKYHKYLGLRLDDVIEILKEKNINYIVKTIRGKKDKDKLVIPRVIKISEIENDVELIVSYFSDSLV